MRRPDRLIVAMLGLVSLCSVLLGVSAATAAPLAEPPLVATPQGACGLGSNPESDIQGRVPAADHESGRAAEGYSCNAERIGFFDGDVPEGLAGGFKVHRYVDEAGHECAFYDTTLVFGLDLFDGGTGVNVLDMTDPTSPVLTASLVTPAMLSPHESLVLSEERGLLMATLGNPGTNVGVLDIYDVSADCRTPQLLSSTVSGLFGHESGLAPDGMTYYSAGTVTGTIVPVDISDPMVPVPLLASIHQIQSHGLSISADGNRAYVATVFGGVTVLDVSEIQSREPLAEIREVSLLGWESMSIPQNAIPITADGDPYLVEIDEFGSGTEVGAARIIDIADEQNPTVLSNMRLAVHQPENFERIADDVGTDNPIQGYAGHYCSVPTPVDPQIVACSMILSGLRVFSIVDPANPVEIAYYNSPSDDAAPTSGNYAMSAPAFVPERNEIWYSDGFTGFHVVRLTNDTFSGQPVPAQVDPPTSATPTAEPGTAAPATGTLPATGGRIPIEFVVMAVLSGLAALALARRSVRPEG